MTSQDIRELEQAAGQAAAAEDHARAAALWAEVAARDPDRAEACNKAAVALRRLGRFDESDAMIARAMARHGTRPIHQIILGDTAMDRQDWHKALDHWRALRELDPMAEKGYLRAAQACLRLSRLDEAEALCREGLRRLPRARRLLACHAEIAVRRKDWPEARARLVRALQIHPGDRALRRRRDEIAARSGEAPPLQPPAATGARAAAGGLRARAYRILRRLLKPDPGPARPLPEGARPGIRALERHLTQVQQQGSKMPLQQRIEEARKVWAMGVRLPRHAGVMRLLDRAREDARLAAILNGETRRNPRRAPGDPIRVVFYFPHVTQTDNLMPLYERMHGDPRFAPMILCSRSDGRAQADSHGFYAAKYPADQGHVVIDGGPHLNHTPSFYELDADLVFFHTPYSLNVTRPFYLRADFAVRHCRVANVTYGYPLLSLDSASAHVYAGGHVKKCDLVFAESPACIEPYARHLDRRRIHVTGYTKVDEFRRHLDPVPFETRAAGGAPLNVMWTPHWQLPGDPKGDTETSNFLRYHKIMLQIAARPDLVLHVRPHPLLRLRLKAMGIMSFAEYDAVMERFRKAGARVYPANEGVSYVPALMAADVLISDFSSLVAEYTITNRPIIFCRTHDVWTNGKWIGAFGKELIENCCYVVDDEAGMQQALDTILTTRRHPKAGQMAAFVERHQLFPEGSATARICDVIEAELRQPS